MSKRTSFFKNYEKLKNYKNIALNTKNIMQQNYHVRSYKLDNNILNNSKIMQKKLKSIANINYSKIFTKNLDKLFNYVYDNQTSTSLESKPIVKYKFDNSLNINNLVKNSKGQIISDITEVLTKVNRYL